MSKPARSDAYLPPEEAAKREAKGSPPSVTFQALLERILLRLLRRLPPFRSRFHSQARQTLRSPGRWPETGLRWR